MSDGGSHVELVEYYTRKPADERDSRSEEGISNSGYLTDEESNDVNVNQTNPSAHDTNTLVNQDRIEPETIESRGNSTISAEIKKEALELSKITDKPNVQISEMNDVTMRHTKNSSAVHPVLIGGDGLTLPGADASHSQKQNGGEKDDMADGMEVFTNEPFTPLLTSNQYQTRKLAAQALMDVALMMANISQLRTLIGLGPNHSDNFYMMVAMVICSLILQVVFAILMFVILVREGDQQQKKDYLETINALQERGGMSNKAKENARQSIIREMNDFKHVQKTAHLNYVTMVLVFLITVVNMFITGFGIHKT